MLNAHVTIFLTDNANVLEFKRKDQEIQKEAIFFNCAHFIDYFANVSSCDDARERCVRCVLT